MIGIYKITNKITGKIYIGQSVNIKRRFRDHKNRESNSDLLKDYQKYGLENFSFELIEECQERNLDEREKYWVKYYNSFNEGYNQTAGGSGSPHFVKLNQQTLLEIIDLLKNSKMYFYEIAKKYNISIETLRLINNGTCWHNNNENYPLRITNAYPQEKKKKEKKISKCPPKEQLIKELYETNFCQVGKKYGVTDNAVRRWCDKYNIPRNKDTFRAWYEKENNISPKKKEFYRGKVYQYDNEDHSKLIKVWNNLAEANNYYNEYSHISQVCKDKRLSSCGYYWRFEEEYYKNRDNYY